MNERSIEAEVTIRSGVDAEVEAGRGIKVNVADVNLEPLTATENGAYSPGIGVDGFSDVTVNVPERMPVLEPLSVTENGEYFPGAGVDGFNDVLVDVPTNIRDAYVCEGTFKATETGMLTIDTGYDGAGYPKVIVFHQNSDLDDSNLSDFANQSFMAIAAVKCYPSEPEYAETVNLDSFMLSLAYKYGTGTATRFTQSTGYVLSQDDPTYKISNAIRMPDSRTLKVWAGDSYTGEGGYFMVGVQYKYRIIYTEPKADEEPSDENVVKGHFQTDTAGVLTIDLPYYGDAYPKAVLIYDAEGIIKEDVPRAYTMTAYCAFKNNAQEPTYDGDTANNGFRYQIVYTGATTYTSTAGSPAYVFTQADPVLGVTNCIKMPDNKTLKVYVSNATAGTSTRFRVGMKYKYQVIY